MKSVREMAADILVSVEKNGAYSSFSLGDILKKSGFADSRDRQLLASLVYCAVEHKLTLDYNISLYLKQPLGKLHPFVLALLRIGAVQIIYFDKIPASAAVNECVKTAKKRSFGFASGLINAVLRRIAENGCRVMQGDSPQALGIRYSFPEELVSHFISEFGLKNTLEIFDAFDGRRPIYIRVNTLKTDSSALRQSLESEGVSVSQTNLENCLEISDFGDITALDSFNNGLFHVQDMSSQKCAAALAAEPDDTVIDCCAAPGGKSFTAAQYMKNRGKIIACDIHSHRVELIKKGAERLGISCIEPICFDASELPAHFSSVDAVLCDVPCSGFGVIGRKPEIKYRPLSEISGLPEIQYDILSRASSMLRHGGRLVYSTCTLNRSENDDVCVRFLTEHKDFSVMPFTDACSVKSKEGFMTFLPEKNGGDGFFTAVFIRS